MTLGICRESDFSLEKGAGCNYCIKKNEGYISGKGVDNTLYKRKGYKYEKEGEIYNLYIYLWKRRMYVSLEKREGSMYLWKEKGK